MRSVKKGEKGLLEHSWDGATQTFLRLNDRGSEGLFPPVSIHLQDINVHQAGEDQVLLGCICLLA